MNDLLAALAARPLLGDGAMGTQLFARGLGSGDCGMLWNTERAELVRSVHDAYRQAGCNLITTNTFGGTAYALALHGTGTAERMAELNRAGAQVAREVANNSAWVLGDVGPFGDFLEPLGDMEADELHSMFRAQIAALADGGVDAILIETMSDPAEMEIALSAAKEATSLPVLATYAFQKSSDGTFRTMMGITVDETVERAVAAGADIVGANCGVELSFPDYLELARQIVRSAGKTPVILQPNAGSPQIVDGETRYNATPDEMAAVVKPLLDIGVRIVGGCCGTSPTLLAAMSRKITC